MSRIELNRIELNSILFQHKEIQSIIKFNLKLYCLSGLGVDERAFQNIDIEGVELIHISWIDPIHNESLDQYSKRLFNTINPEDDYNLLGVSFGGMVAAEFAKIKEPKKLFLISTIQNKSQLSLLFKVGSALRIYKILPKALIQKSNPITNYFFGVKSLEDKRILGHILKDTSPTFLKWAINAIVNWNNTQDPKGIKIHGSNDKMLPLGLGVHYVIKKGGHFMIVNRAKEITEILTKEITNN